MLWWVSPFGHPRINAWEATPRGLSQPPTSFIGFRRQGIHRWLFVAWKNKDARARYGILKGHDERRPRAAWVVGWGQRSPEGDVSDRSGHDRSREAQLVVLGAVLPENGTEERPTRRLGPPEDASRGRRGLRR